LNESNYKLNFKFTKAMIKSDTLNLEASWLAMGPATPFFSTTIEEPTDLPVLAVVLYPESGVKKINCEIESYKGARVPNISNVED